MLQCCSLAYRQTERIQRLQNLWELLKKEQKKKKNCWIRRKIVGDPWTKMAQKQKRQVDFCDVDYIIIFLSKSPIKQRPGLLDWMRICVCKRAFSMRVYMRDCSRWTRQHAQSVKSTLGAQTELLVLQIFQYPTGPRRHPCCLITCQGWSCYTGARQQERGA